MQVDKPYLIIGGGISGLSLAYQFQRRNIPFKIITKEENHSSVVAGGFIIPIVFRRTTKSWNIDTFLPYARSFYQELETKFQASFWHPIPVRRSFSHLQEREDWVKKQNDIDYCEYLGEIDYRENEHIYHEYGSGMVKNAAWVDTKKIIQALRNLFDQAGKLEYAGTPFVPDENSYQGIIYCEGYELIYNPLFNYLPLDPTKGQILTVRSEHLPETESINRKCFVLPIGNQLFKVGSTYEWSNTTLQTTEEARLDLEKKLKELIDVPFETVEQLAGIRPTVKDRRPLLGEHPIRKGTYVFNGLGTKGFLLAPILSEYLADFILNKKPLHPEIDIQRYEKLTNFPQSHKI